MFPSRFAKALFALTLAITGVAVVSTKIMASGKASVDLEQCSNKPSTCDASHSSNWQTGNLGQSNSQYLEGQSVDPSTTTTSTTSTTSTTTTIPVTTTVTPTTVAPTTVPASTVAPTTTAGVDLNVNVLGGTTTTVATDEDSLIAFPSTGTNSMTKGFWVLALLVLGGFAWWMSRRNLRSHGGRR